MSWRAVQVCIRECLHTSQPSSRWINHCKLNQLSTEAFQSFPPFAVSSPAVRLPFTSIISCFKMHLWDLVPCAGICEFDRSCHSALPWGLFDPQTPAVEEGAFHPQPGQWCLWSHFWIFASLPVEKHSASVLLCLHFSSEWNRVTFHTFKCHS